MSGSIQVYVSEIRSALLAHSTTLPGNQSTRAPGVSRKRWNEYVASRLVITKLLAPGWHLNEENRKQLFVYDSQSMATRRISLSHSHSLVAVAIGPVSQDLLLGVDVEKIRSDWTPEKAGFFCNIRQREKGLSLPKAEQAEFFTQLWTQKEAYFKATQNPFVQKDFDQDFGIYSRKLAEPFFVSVYSQPALATKLSYIDLNASINTNAQPV